MKIAVNICSRWKGGQAPDTNLLVDLFTKLAANNQQYPTLFITEKNNQLLPADYLNCTCISLGTSNNPLLLQWRYAIKLPSLLKKKKIDVYVSTKETFIENTKTPQCLLINELDFLHYPNRYKKTQLSFYQKNMNNAIYKAAHIITTSLSTKKEIIAQYKIEANKISVLPVFVNSNDKPATEDNKRKTKELYTSGREYFMYAGVIEDESNIINLLKAFSLFKKRQQTAMKLVLVNYSIYKAPKRLTLLDTYKYREDVVLLQKLTTKEKIEIISASYAFISVLQTTSLSIEIPMALICGIPVIATQNEAIKEIAKEAALYANPDDVNAIASQMMLLYKDENLRSKMMREAINNSAGFTTSDIIGFTETVLNRALK